MYCSVFLVLSLVLTTHGFEGNRKFDEDMNNAHNSERFRSGRVQQLWDKARQLDLSTVTMTELYGELKQYDHHIMEMKMIKAEGGDENGMLQADLQRELNDIMFKYGMASNRNEDHADKQPLQRAKKLFQDPKLEALWRENSSNDRFSKEELDKLFIEFKHHEDKEMELTQLLADIKKFDEMSENSMERYVDQSIHSKRTHADGLQEEVKESFERLQLLSRKKKDDSLPFTEPRVLELWRIMENGSLSEREKKSLMEELHHFEKRIEKHRHFKEQLKNSAEKIDFHGGKEQASTERVTLHQKLHDKVGHLSSVIQKTFATLKSRLRNNILEHHEL